MAAAFEGRGFARLPGFLARDELPAFRAAVDAVLAAPLRDLPLSRDAPARLAA